MRPLCSRDYACPDPRRAVPRERDREGAPVRRLALLLLFAVALVSPFGAPASRALVQGSSPCGVTRKNGASP